MSDELDRNDRRDFLRMTLAAAPVVALTGPGIVMSAWADEPARQPSPQTGAAGDSGFLALSRALTDRHGLNPVTAQRIEAALVPSGVRQAGELPKLIALATNSASGKDLLQAASDAGLKDLAQDIVAAWYTGTVGQGPKAVVVAYQEALMYQPVRDALTVPTYCSYGPLWWKDTTPPDPAIVLPESPASPSSKAL